MIFPGTIKENEVNSFTPRPVGTSIGDEPPSLTLKPGTTYWVVTSNVAEFNGTGLNVGLTNRSLDTGTSVGWSLGNARSKENYDDVLWTDSSPLRFEIRGTGGTPATGAPTITGTAEVGQTLTADTAAIMDGDGLNNVNYMYQWIRGATEIDEATASTYTLVAGPGHDDQGKGELHRQCRLRRGADQRGDGDRRGGAEHPRDGRADDHGHGAGRADADGDGG